ncbi:MAG: HEPN domain-containing protein [Ardenticatenaceae bacterium]|nr:HEPN domain-containing protein [Ardenticatenaceae bacterium]
MTLEYEQEIAANLERAERSLQAARELVNKGYYDFAASRAYYAAFYGATTKPFRLHRAFLQAIRSLISG